MYARWRPQPPALATRFNTFQATLEQLYRDRRIHFFHAGQQVPLPSNTLWVVCRGWVSLQGISAEDRPIWLGLTSPAMVFGEPLTLCDSFAAYPLTDVHLMQLAMTEVEHDPRVALEVLRQQSQRLRQASELTAVLQLKRAPHRLRQLLHWLATEIGDPHPQGTRLAVRLTHQQLAQAACTTRVTVTRLMRTLQAEGGLIWDRDRHLILTPAFFSAIA